MSNNIEITVKTWKKESYDLFDYDSQQYKIDKYSANQNTEIFRKQFEIFINQIGINSQKNSLSSTNQQQQNSELISRLLWDIEKKCFYLDNSVKLKNYLVVKSFQNDFDELKGYEVYPGDIIKLGRVKLRVIECKYKEGSKQIKLNDQINFKSVQDRNGKCRICLDNNIDEESQFIPINICNCKGSFEYYHLFCLKKWIQNKVSEQIDDNITSFKTRFLECEVCKMNLPYQLFIDNKKQIQQQIIGIYKIRKYSLLDIEKPLKSPYIILEVLCPIKQKAQTLYVINLEKTHFVKIGRGHISDIKISDISVSRFHASIQYQDDKYILTDNNSKFGTLILLQQKLFIQNEVKVIQIGKTVISFDTNYIENNLEKSKDQIN